MELNDTISILETLDKHSDLLELNSDVIDNIYDCVLNLKEELEGE